MILIYQPEMLGQPCCQFQILMSYHASKWPITVSNVLKCKNMYPNGIISTYQCNSIELHLLTNVPGFLLMIKLIQITYFIHWLVFNESPQLVYTHTLPFIPT